MIKAYYYYNLGMAFAKFYAEKLLNIPSLVHVESLEGTWIIEFLTLKMEKVETRSCGAMSNGDWHF